MFFLKSLIVHQVLCLCIHFSLVVVGMQHNTHIKKTTKLHKTEGIDHEVKTRAVKEETAPVEFNATSNATRKNKVEDITGSRRQLAAIDAYPNQPIPVHGPFHHVHFVPKPFPVESVRYVPRPLPVPYAVPSHIHVSHLHLRPKCEYNLVFLTFR